MTRLLLITGGVTCVVFLGVLVDHQSRTPAVRSPAPRAESDIFAPGWVEGASLEIELRPQLSGRIVEVLAREGQEVAEGEVLLRLDDREHRQQVALAEAKLALARSERERLLNGARGQEREESAALARAKEAELERAQLAWKRISELREANAVSQQEADNQRTLVAALVAEVEAARARSAFLEADARADEVAMANARVEAAQAERELAKVRHERTRLGAPCRGRILDVSVEPGELTGPDAPEPTIIMANTDLLRVRAFIDELDAPRVRVGSSARVTADGLPGQTIRGRVSHLSPRMARKELTTDHPSELHDTKTREVWIELDHPDSLVIGLRVDAVIETSTESTSPRPPAGEVGVRESPPVSEGLSTEGVSP